MIFARGTWSPVETIGRSMERSRDYGRSRDDGRPYLRNRVP